MISKGLFTQVAMIALAIGIVFTYIRPTFSEITNKQDDIALYQVERQKISAVNSQLASLVNQLETVSALDQRKLLTYMPDDVDIIAVPRVIQNMVNETGVILKQISYSGVIEIDKNKSDDTAPVAHGFAFDVEGTYPQIKELIALLEQNEYPLEIHSLSINVLDGGFLSGQFQLVTYAHEYPKTVNNKSN